MGHVTEGIFCLLYRQDKKRDKKLEVQLFLTRLLVLLVLVGWLCFCLVLEASDIGLTIGLAIGGVESISEEVGFSF